MQTSLVRPSPTPASPLSFQTLQTVMTRSRIPTNITTSRELHAADALTAVDLTRFLSRAHERERDGYSERAKERDREETPRPGKGGCANGCGSGEGPTDSPLKRVGRKEVPEARSVWELLSLEAEEP